MPDLLRASALYCGSTIPPTVVLGYARPRYWSFWDYSWRCPVCAISHCSECTYVVDDIHDRIVVYDCGRLGVDHAYWDSTLTS